MAVKKYVTIEGLTHFKTKLDGLYVKSEDGKTLFDGKYSSLTEKPAIDGNELTAESTASELGLAKSTDIPGVATTAKAGTVKPDGTTITVDPDGTIKVADLADYLKSSDAASTYLKIADYKVATEDEAGKVKPDGTTITVTEEGVISAKLDGYVTSETLGTYALKSELPKTATTDAEGLVKPDGETIEIVEGAIKVKDAANYAKKTDLPTAATKEAAGIVKIGDGITLSEDGTGTISVTMPEGSDDILTKTEAKTTYASKDDISDMVTNTSLTSTLEPYAKTETVTTNIESAKSEVLEQVNTKIASTYKAKGSKATVTELPTPSADNVGDVYNMSAGFTTNENFSESGTYYPKGTNVVVADIGDETYKYDVLAGDYDLSVYQLASELQDVSNAEIDALFTA